MASGGVLTIFEENIQCTPCSSKDKKVAFKHYCIDCEAYYCNECFEFHLRIPYLAKHIVLKNEDVEIWSNLQYRCKPHGRNFEFFCRNHKKLCCHICVSLQHRSCEKIEYIPECANDKSLKEEVTPMIRRIDHNLQNINTHEEKFQMRSSTNEDSKKCCLKAITDYRTWINATLDELETKTKNIMEDKFEMNSSYFTEKTNELRILKCGLEKLNQQLHTSSKGTEILVYISLLEGETFVEDVERKLSRMDTSNTKEDFELVLDDQFERLLKSTSRFGCIRDKQISSVEISSAEYKKEDFPADVEIKVEDSYYEEPDFDIEVAHRNDEEPDFDIEVEHRNDEEPPDFDIEVEHRNDDKPVSDFDIEVEDSYYEKPVSDFDIEVEDSYYEKPDFDIEVEHRNDEEPPDFDIEVEHRNDDKPDLDEDVNYGDRCYDAETDAYNTNKKSDATNRYKNMTDVDLPDKKATYRYYNEPEDHPYIFVSKK